MSGPTPAVPSEGAAFYRYGDVPEGWEWRDSDAEDWRLMLPGTRPKFTGSYPLVSNGTVVEARPKPFDPSELVGKSVTWGTKQVTYVCLAAFVDLRGRTHIVTHKPGSAFGPELRPVEGMDGLEVVS